MTDQTLKEYLESATPPHDMERYDAWVHVRTAIATKVRSEVMAPENLNLPFQIVGINPPPVWMGEDVWVWEDEDWDGGAGIGWHRTSMYGGYAGANAGSNWWNEPVCGRCLENPYWVPGNVTRDQLPDMSKDGPGKRRLAEMEAECKRRVKELTLPCPLPRPPHPVEYFMWSTRKLGMAAGEAVNKAVREKTADKDKS